MKKNWSVIIFITLFTVSNAVEHQNKRMKSFTTSFPIKPEPFHPADALPTFHSHKIKQEPASPAAQPYVDSFAGPASPYAAASHTIVLPSCQKIKEEIAQDPAYIQYLTQHFQSLSNPYSPAKPLSPGAQEILDWIGNIGRQRNRDFNEDTNPHLMAALIATNKEIIIAEQKHSEAAFKELLTYFEAKQREESRQNLADDREYRAKQKQLHLEKQQEEAKRQEQLRIAQKEAKKAAQEEANKAIQAAAALKLQKQKALEAQLAQQQKEEEARKKSEQEEANKRQIFENAFSALSETAKNLAKTGLGNLLPVKRFGLYGAYDLYPKTMVKLLKELDPNTKGLDEIKSFFKNSPFVEETNSDDDSDNDENNSQGFNHIGHYSMTTKHPSHELTIAPQKNIENDSSFSQSHFPYHAFNQFGTEVKQEQVDEVDTSTPYAPLQNNTLHFSPEAGSAAAAEEQTATTMSVFNNAAIIAVHDLVPAGSNPNASGYDFFGFFNDDPFHTPPPAQAITGRDVTLASSRLPFVTPSAQATAGHADVLDPRSFSPSATTSNAPAPDNTEIEVFVPSFPLTYIPVVSSKGDTTQGVVCPYCHHSPQHTEKINAQIEKYQTTNVPIGVKDRIAFGNFTFIVTRNSFKSHLFSLHRDVQAFNITCPSCNQMVQSDLVHIHSCFKELHDEQKKKTPPTPKKKRNQESDNSDNE